MNDAPPKTVRVELRAHADHPSAVANAALCAARAGARVLVLRNSVTDAIATQAALERERLPADDPLLFRVRGVATLHHEHFAREDRVALDRALEARLGRRASQRRGCVVVAAETREQRDDLDADFLLTDLAPMSVLHRRFRVVHRHGERDPFRVPGFRVASAVVLLRDEPIDVRLGLEHGGEANAEGLRARPEERIRRVRFGALAVRSPFGSELCELELRGGHELGADERADVTPSEVRSFESAEGQVSSFALGELRYVYDRWGLRRLP